MIDLVAMVRGEREYRISSCFTCDSSGIVYLLGCEVCGKQYVVGSTFTTFRARFNDYKSASRRFDKGESQLTLLSLGINSP